MEKRRINLSGFRTLGRVFKAGDLILLDTENDNLIHVYTDDDSLLPAFLESPISNISVDHFRKLIQASEAVEE